MINYQYMQLMQDLAEIADEVYSNQDPCNFEDEPETVYFDADFSDLWSDR